MSRRLRGQPALLVSIGAVLVTVVLTVGFLAVVSRPPAPRPRSRASLPPSPVASPTPDVPFTPLPGPTATVCVDVGRLPLDRRLEQLLIVSGVFSDLEASQPLAREGVGGFVFFGQPKAGAAASIATGLASLRAAAVAGGQAVPWMSTDEEGGYIQRLAAVAGPLPSPRQMAASWTPAQVRTALAAHAQALRALGIDMDLAPVLDVAPPGDTVADEADRAFSDTPAVVAAYGVAYAAGLRTGGVVAVVKHFPGLGHADANTDLAASTDPPLSGLEQNDLLPFEAAIGSGVRVVMMSHVRVPGLSGTQPASLAPATYQLLRGTLHFTGVTMTDALDAEAITAAGYTQPGAVVAAIEAGADLAMVDSQEWQPALTALRQAVAVGALRLAVVNAAVARILVTKGVGVCSGSTA